MKQRTIFNLTDTVKRLLLVLLAAGALVPLARGTQLTYNNFNGLFAPPQDPSVDATNFFNNAIFSVSGSGTFTFSSVENFTNRNVINISPSVTFDTEPPLMGSPHRAKNFVNANNLNTNFNSTTVNAFSVLTVDATNIINRGNLSTGGNAGRISLLGEMLDISRSAITIGTLGLGGLMTDSHWGFSTNAFEPDVNLIPTAPVVPPHKAIFPGGITNNNYTFPMTGPHLVARFRDDEGVTNRAGTIVYVQTSSTTLTNVSVTFSGGDPTHLPTVFVEWQLTSTNALGQLVNNYLTLVDTYGSTTTNLFITNTIANTFRPKSFTVTVGTTSQAFGAPASAYTSQIDDEFFGTNSPAPISTNLIAGYRTDIIATAANPTNSSTVISFADRVRDLPGRVEIQADKVLNMNLTRIQSGGYTLISATNHFVGSSNAVVNTVFADMRLNSTNGTLTAQNLIQPTQRRITGSLEIYSGVFSTSSAEFGGNITNLGTALLHTIYINADLAASTASTLLDLNLASHFGTNLANQGSVVIGDSFRVTDQFRVDASSLTVSNTAFLDLTGMPFPSGTWAANVPYLSSFTNYGAIRGLGGFEFFGAGLGAGGTDLPYTNFVNFGFIENYANTIKAINVENSGGIQGDFGGALIEAGTLTIHSGGWFFANGADISVTALNLNIDPSTNAFNPPTFLPGRALFLAISNNVNVGTNFWSVSDGINLLVKPATGDFNLVTVTNTAADFENVFNTWAGADLTPVVGGYVNNGALGRMILDGGANSAFTFADLQDGDQVTNALYVDVLVLRNSATNVDASANLVNVFVQPEMKLYYSHVFFGTTEVTGTLNGVGGGGGFVNVPHAGAINTASIPGSGAGGGNSTLADVGLKVVRIDGAPPSVFISWNTVAGATNHVYYQSASTGGGWQELTSFISNTTGSTTIEDNPGAMTRYYKVRVDVPTQ